MVEISTAASPPRFVMTPSTKTPTCAAVEPRTVTTVYCPLPFTSRTCTPGTIFSKSGRSFCSPLYSSGRMTVTVPGESLDSQSGRFASTVIPASSNSGASEADNASAAPTPPEKLFVMLHSVATTAVPKMCK